MAKLDYSKYSRCTKCGEVFPSTLEYFYQHSIYKETIYLSPECKPCAALRVKTYRQENNESLKKKSKTRREKNKDSIRIKKKAWKKTTQGKAARRRYYLRHKEEERSKRRKRIANTTDEQKEKLRIQQKEWRQANPEKSRESVRKYEEKNPDKVREIRRISAKKWREEHPGEAKENIRLAHIRHPETRRRNHEKRRALKKDVPCVWNQEYEKFCREYWKMVCAYCGREDGFWHIVVMDHYIPISNNGCPGTIMGNMIPACHSKPMCPRGTPSCNQSKKNKNPVPWLVAKLGARRAKGKLQEIETFFAAARAFAES